MNQLEVTECIQYAKESIIRYNAIDNLINDDDYLKWQNKMTDENDFYDYFFGGKNNLNFLIIAVLISRPISGNRNYKIYFEKLNQYLTEFPELQTDKGFKDKITNLGGVNFFSTLSELTLAVQLKSMGYKIIFEHPFTHKVSGNRRDVDITITGDKGEEIHFEVYMPNKELPPNSASGFITLDAHDESLFNKLKGKMIKKFGKAGFSGLNGKVLLAVNIAFMQLLNLRNVLQPVEEEENVHREIFKEIEFAPEVDGVIIFRDDFSSDNSFYSEALQMSGR
ncbi:hypothetical protein LVD15_25445 [Fulvivirga maritima]|uniref:hypothetical protein n=1 Tax=Fulvivirga maritima TaxID=2904247 RepID=UPI001F2DB29A|nr:hypothetical protein [Fulvivirga maritima]UII26601.1 hypothetical protein LVD15_25445 [Fulvivirga maritima]